MSNGQSINNFTATNLEPLPRDRIQVFLAKKVITMDPRWPNATAIAVKDGKAIASYLSI